MAMTLAELARHCRAELRGDPDLPIDGVASLESAGPGKISFVAGEKYRPLLASTRAGAVIVNVRDAGAYAGNALVCANPHLAFAQAASVLHASGSPVPGIDPTAVISPSAQISASACIGPHVVIEADVYLAEGVVIGAGCYIGQGTQIGAGTRLHPQVTIAHQCVLGARCIIYPGAVIGSDGFGYAQDGARWEKVPQLGRVILGDDVEVGANTAIDRGALDDTVIGRGVKLDNLVHVAHNVVIGEDTAIAACVGIAGSTRIGKRCTLAGQVGVVGHIDIADDVHVMGDAVVSHTIREPGVYAGSPLEPYQHWLKNAVRMRQLDDMARRLKKLEQKISALSEGGNIE